MYRCSGKIQYNPLFFRQFSGKIMSDYFVRFVLSPINETIFHTQRINDRKYAHSITSLLGEILNDAEDRYGKRDETYRILGVELSTDQEPYIWFPEYNNDKKSVIIRLTDNCLKDINRAIFQLSHEVVHCLGPCQNSNFLEEGLATYFSEIKAKEYGSTYYANDPKYITARDLVKNLLQLNDDIIKMARKREPYISKFDKSLLLGIDPSIDEKLLDNLLHPFNAHMI